MKSLLKLGSDPLFYALFSQASYSLASFGIMFYCARFMKSEDFGSVAYCLLIFNLFLSWLTVWSGQSWRDNGRREIEASFWPFIVSLFAAFVFIGCYLFYRSRVDQILLCFLSMIVFLLYGLIRRFLILAGQEKKAFFLDFGRFTLLVIYVFLCEAGWLEVNFVGFLGAVLVSGVFPIFIGFSFRVFFNSLGFSSLFSSGFWPKTNGGKRLVLSGLLNIFLSQAVVFLSAFLLSSHDYATLRAYDVFLFPLFFVIQAGEAIVLRQVISNIDDGMTALALSKLSVFFGVLLIPFFVLILLIFFGFFEFDSVFISVEYRHEKNLLCFIFLLGLFISFNSCARIFLIATSHSNWILKATIISGGISLAMLGWVGQAGNAVYYVMSIRLIYEFLSSVACLFDVKKVIEVRN